MFCVCSFDAEPATKRERERKPFSLKASWTILNFIDLFISVCTSCFFFLFFSAVLFFVCLLVLDVRVKALPHSLIQFWCDTKDSLYKQLAHNKMKMCLYVCESCLRFFCSICLRACTALHCDLFSCVRVCVCVSSNCRYIIETFDAMSRLQWVLCALSSRNI